MPEKSADGRILPAAGFYLHLPRVTGYLSFFRCVAIVLGVAPLYEKEYRQPLSAECREACRKLDRFTAEITLVCREHILPSEKAFAYKMKMDAMKRKAGRLERIRRNLRRISTQRRKSANVPVKAEIKCSDTSVSPT